MVVVVDYGMGNIRSVSKAVEFLGKRVKVSDRPEDILSAEKIILPGVGNFGQAVEELEKRGVRDILIKKINEGIPFLGICLGLHLLFEQSQESKGRYGLGIFKGSVKRFPSGVIIPHMGWNQVRFIDSDSILARNIGLNEYFYFAHSYYVFPEDDSIVFATTFYGGDFCSAVFKDNVVGVQFHPEKSQKTGIQFLSNFLEFL